MGVCRRRQDSPDWSVSTLVTIHSSCPWDQSNPREIWLVGCWMGVTSDLIKDGITEVDDEAIKNTHTQRWNIQEVRIFLFSNRLCGFSTGSEGMHVRWTATGSLSTGEAVREDEWMDLRMDGDKNCDEPVASSSLMSCNCSSLVFKWGRRGNVSRSHCYDWLRSVQ